MKKTNNLGDFLKLFFGPFESMYDPIFYPGTIHIIILSFGHSLVYVPKRNLIQCMGDMDLMAIICKKWPFLKNDFFGSLESRWDPNPSPDALWMIILSFGHSILYVPMRNDSM